MTSGFSTHCHHDIRFEFCYSLEFRQQYIKEYKPPEEQTLRLRLLQIIPIDRLPHPFKLLIAKQARFNAKWVRFFATWDGFNVDQDSLFDKRTKLVAAWDRLINQYLPELEALHKELCPDCPWDGKTIFTRKDSEGNWY